MSRTLLTALLIFSLQPVSASDDFSLFHVAPNKQLQSQEMPQISNPHTYRASAKYFVDKTQKLKLRVTKIPRKYPWVAKDVEGNVEAVPLGSRIVAENIYDVVLEDAHGQPLLLPAGSKFYGKVAGHEANGKYQKDGYVEIEFLTLEIKGSHKKSKIKIQTTTDTKHGLGTKISKSAQVGFYTLASAVGTPVLLTQALGLKGHFLGINTNPYFLGGSAALGAAVGLAYGISRPGKFRSIEPGTEFELELSDNWGLAGIEHLETSFTKGRPGKREGGPLLPGPNQNASVGAGFDLKVVKVKKSHDLYGDACLAVTFDYKNPSSEELRYSSFKLVDSMGREYEPSVKSYQDESVIGLAPKAARLTLLYPTEFLKTVHQLKVVKLNSYQTIASARVVLD